MNGKNIIEKGKNIIEKGKNIMEKGKNIIDNRNVQITTFILLIASILFCMIIKTNDILPTPICLIYIYLDYILALDGFSIYLRSLVFILFIVIIFYCIFTINPVKNWGIGITNGITLLSILVLLGIRIYNKFTKPLSESKIVDMLKNNKKVDYNNPTLGKYYKDKVKEPVNKRVDDIKSKGINEIWWKTLKYAIIYCVFITSALAFIYVKWSVRPDWMIYLWTPVSCVFFSLSCWYYIKAKSTVDFGAIFNFYFCFIAFLILLMILIIHTINLIKQTKNVDEGRDKTYENIDGGVVVFYVILIIFTVFLCWLLYEALDTVNNQTKEYVKYSSLWGMSMLFIMNILTDLNINPYKAQPDGVYKKPDYMDDYGVGDWIEICVYVPYYLMNNFVFAAIISIFFSKTGIRPEGGGARVPRSGGDFITMVTIFTIIGIFLNLTMRFQTEDYRNNKLFWVFAVLAVVCGAGAGVIFLGNDILYLVIFFIICMVANMGWILFRGPTKIKYLLRNKNDDINVFPIFYSGLLFLMILCT